LKTEVFTQSKHQGWLTPTILGTQEAEIRRIAVGSQPGQIVHETLSQKHPSQRKGWWSDRGVGPEFKPQYHKKTKQNPAVFIYIRS
jgi:hypothetical protein